MADVNGTSGNDYIHDNNSTPPPGYNDIRYGGSPDAIHGNGGDDIIKGVSFDENGPQIFGDDGDDYLSYRNAEFFDGGAGFDTVEATVYDDSLLLKNVEKVLLASVTKFTLVGDSSQVGLTLVAEGVPNVVGYSRLDASAYKGQVHFLVHGGFNSFEGTGRNDVVDIEAGGTGGSDLAAGAGNDVFNLLGTSIVSPSFSPPYLSMDGGVGNDTLTLTGDYSDPSSFATLRISSVERFELGASFDYVLIARNDMVAAGALLTVSAAALGAANFLNFDGSAETDGRFNLQGGQGDDGLVGGRLDDSLIGNAGDDVLDISKGGTDTVRGGDGDDRIFAGAALTGADRINGGAGFDVVELDGTYKGLSIDSQVLVDVEVLSMVRGHRYTLASSGSGFGGGLLTVDGTALGAGDALSFDGGGEVDGRLQLYGGAASDRLTGGALDDSIVGALGNDLIDLSTGGADTAEGDAGDDRFIMGAALDIRDRLDGGTGMDTVQLSGAYNIQLTAAMLSDMETIELGAGFDYTLQTSNSLVAEDELLRVDGRSLGAADVLQFDGSRELDGRFDLLGGDGDDMLRAGPRNASLNGGGGADQLIGGSGGDRFVYRSVSDSTGPEYDTIFGFASIEGDRFDFPTSPAANDPWVRTGTLSTASFNSDLATAIGADQLGVGNAVRFTADAGTLAGQTFLIADANGMAGYQANEDYVIRLA